MNRVAKLLAECRLVSLTGPGGSGKTRLAAEAGAVLADRSRDGVWLVDLAPLTDPSLLPQAVAAALRVPEDPVRPLVETIADSLREKQLLLILDNCEHLIDESADLAETLLSAAPGSGSWPRAAKCSGFPVRPCPRSLLSPSRTLRRRRPARRRSCSSTPSGSSWTAPPQPSRGSL